MIREPRVELVNEIIAELRGSCRAIYNVHEDDDLTLEEYRMTDNEIFECAVCGWWCEISEMEDEGVCSDCCEV